MSDDLTDALRALGRRGPQPYTRLVAAYLRGSGTRLSADEVCKLIALDDAVVRVVLTAAEEAEEPRHAGRTVLNEG